MDINLNELNRKGYLTKFVQGEVICHVCQGKEWVVQKTVYQIPEFNPTSAAEQLVLPMVVVNCNTCGHAVPFLAVEVGGVRLVKQ